MVDIVQRIKEHQQKIAAAYENAGPKNLLTKRLPNMPWQWKQEHDIGLKIEPKPVSGGKHFEYEITLDNKGISSEFDDKDLERYLKNKYDAAFGNLYKASNTRSVEIAGKRISFKGDDAFKHFYQFVTSIKQEFGEVPLKAQEIDRQIQEIQLELDKQRRGVTPISASTSTMQALKNAWDQKTTRSTAKPTFKQSSLYYMRESGSVVAVVALAGMPLMPILGASVLVAAMTTAMIGASVKEKDQAAVIPDDLEKELAFEQKKGTELNKEWDDLQTLKGQIDLIDPTTLKVVSNNTLAVEAAEKLTKEAEAPINAETAEKQARFNALDALYKAVKAPSPDNRTIIKAQREARKLGIDPELLKSTAKQEDIETAKINAQVDLDEANVKKTTVPTPEQITERAKEILANEGVLLQAPNDIPSVITALSNATPSIDIKDTLANRIIFTPNQTTLKKDGDKIIITEAEGSYSRVITFDGKNITLEEKDSSKKPPIEFTTKYTNDNGTITKTMSGTGIQGEQKVEYSQTNEELLIREQDRISDSTSNILSWKDKKRDLAYNTAENIKYGGVGYAAGAGAAGIFLAFQGLAAGAGIAALGPLIPAAIMVGVALAVARSANKVQGKMAQDPKSLSSTPNVGKDPNKTWVKHLQDKAAESGRGAGRTT